MMIDICLGDVGVEILTLDKSQEELIYNLDMWPGHFQDRLILFRIKGLALGGNRGRDGSKEVFGEHLDHSRVHGFGDY